MSDREPKIIAFLCNWCSYAGADLAGVSRFQYAPTVRALRTMCSGRVDPLHIMEGLESGFDGVFVYGCHIGDCHYLMGNFYTAKRVEVVRELLDLSGIGRERVQLRWVSAAEGKEFAGSVTELSDVVRGLGPLDKEKCKLQLPAVVETLGSAKLRWLLGMERHLTEVGNVYDEKVDKQQYDELLKAATTEEYQKALILEALRDGPQSVREIAARSGLPVYRTSLLLGAVEKAGKVDLQGYDGATPKFVRLDA